MIKALILTLVLAFTAINYCKPAINTKHNHFRKCSEQVSNREDESALVQMQLQKLVYKQYEPIEVLVRYINTGNMNDSIYMMFDDFVGFVDFDIKNDIGININEKDVQGFTLGIAVRPHYIVKPSDTFVTTITLNGFGKKTEEGKTYFQYSNYFPVGKYKFNIIIYGDQHRLFTNPITTDFIEFEIIDNDAADMSVIDLSREGKFYDIQKNFTNNYFYEYALREYVKSNIGKYYKNEITQSELEISYIGYFNNFPQSYYTIPFVMQYLSLVSNDSATNIDYFAQKLLNDYKNSPIEEFLNNNIMLPAMKLNIIESKKVEKRLNK